MPVVIVENDVSKWDDQSGSAYHFPKRYRAWLTSGTEVVYYKGSLRDKNYASSRLSAAPHYFAIARIGKVSLDPNSTKGDLYAQIEDFVPFNIPVPIKIDGTYLETIPTKKLKNYWRNGVRPVSQDDYEAILEHANLVTGKPQEQSHDYDEDAFSFESAYEGSKSSYFGTRYERRADLRKQAIAIHGLSCNACGFNFEQVYGEHAKGLIHVHHVLPISIFGGEKIVNPETDLITLCANCHAVVHRRREMALSIEQLKDLLRTPKGIEH